MTSAGTAISARTVIEVTVTRVTPGTFVVVPNEASVNSAMVWGRSSYSFCTGHALSHIGPAN